MGTGRHSHAAVALDGHLYVLGGEHEDNNLFGEEPETLASVERYDPVTDTWEAVAPMGTARTHHVAVAMNGAIIAATGYDGDHYLRSCERYDPATDAWAPAMPDLATARGSAAASVGPDGRLYISGGHNTEFVLASVEAFHPVNNTWWVSTMTTTHEDHALVVLDGTLYAFGGYVQVEGRHSRRLVESFDPQSYEWTRVPEMEPRGWKMVGSSAVAVREI